MLPADLQTLGLTTNLKHMDTHIRKTPPSYQDVMLFIKTLIISSKYQKDDGSIRLSHGVFTDKLMRNFSITQAAANSIAETFRNGFFRYKTANYHPDEEMFVFNIREFQNIQEQVKVLIQTR